MSFQSVLLQTSEDLRRRVFRLSVVEKWRAAYVRHEYDKNMVALTHAAANTFFLFMSHSLLYVTLRYTTADYYSQHGEWVVYYMKVVHTFVYVNVMANWLCVKAYDSKYIRDREMVGRVENAVIIDILEKRRDMCTRSGGGLKHNGALGDRISPQNSTSHIPPRLSDPSGDYANMCQYDKEKSSWKYCEKCALLAPPRAHHCPVCDVCILKRDHHCFLLAVCIGYFNQRFFIVLAFYLLIGCAYGKYLIYNYLSNHFFPYCDYRDLVLPYTIYRCLFGDIAHHILLMIFNMYFLWMGAMLGFGFLFGQLSLLAMGKTSNEAAKKLRVSSTTSLQENFQDVFGDFWMLNFIFPANILFRQKSDGTHWKGLVIFDS